MKKITYIILVLIVAFSFSSCEKKITTADVTTKTAYLPVITLEGESQMIVELGDTYVEPGATATAGDKEIDVTITGTVNTSVFGKYILTYSAESADGYSNSFDRIVWVVPPKGDFATSISGYYKSTVNRIYADHIVTKENLEYILISETGNANEYLLSDAVGGYYDIALGYGSDYAFQDGTFTYDFSTSAFAAVTDGVAPGWGNHAVIGELVVDAAAKTVFFVGQGDFANSRFECTLTQQ